MVDPHLQQRLDALLRASLAQGVALDVSRRAGPPAAPEQLAALERHWGHRLPPSYRQVLEVYDGMHRIWSDVCLLSVQDILDGASGTRIFARGTESSAALAFDPAQVSEDGELAVVQVSAEGEAGGWPSFAALLQDLSFRLLFGRPAGGAATHYLWTSLWPFWLSDSSDHSRLFIPGRGPDHASSRGLFQVRAAGSERLLSAAEQAQVDSHFTQALSDKPAGRELAILLTDGIPEDVANDCYVYYEPCAHLVIALNPRVPDPKLHGRIVVHAAGPFVDALGGRTMELFKPGGQLLAEGRLADALRLSIDLACQWLSAP